MSKQAEMIQRVEEAAAAIMGLFRARTNAFAEAYYDKKSKRWAYGKKSKHLTEKQIFNHINDTKYPGIGIYPMLDGNECWWIASDFDAHNLQEEEEIHKAYDRIYEIAELDDVPLYHELSKSGKGSHFWIFFSEAIPAYKARRFMAGLLTKAGAYRDKLTTMDRMFPSQDTIKEDGKGYGNLIHLPFSAKFIADGTYFVDRQGVITVNDPEEILDWVENVERVDSSFIDNTLGLWGIEARQAEEFHQQTDHTQYQYSADGIKEVMQDPFIQWCNDNASSLNHAAKMALVTNLMPYGEEGMKYAYTILSRAHNYNAEMTEKQIVSLMGYGPMTYNYILANTSFTDAPEVSYRSPAAAGVKQRATKSKIWEWEGGYYINDDGKKYPITNFVLHPTKIMESETGLEWVCDIITKTRKLKNVVFSSEVLTSEKEFLTFIRSKVRDASYYGTKRNLVYLIDFLNETYPKTPLIKGYNVIGLHQVGDSQQWSVITDKAAWNSSGEVGTAQYYNPNGGDLKNITYKPKSYISDDSLKEIGDLMFRFNELEVCAGLWGWMIGAMVKHRLWTKYSLRFPILIIHGQSGSGKSQTMTRIGQPFFGDKGLYSDISGGTKFTMLKSLSSSNTFPAWFDELKPSRMKRQFLQDLSASMRALYDNMTSFRGRQDQGMNQYQNIAPVVICGEQTFTETAVLQRLIDMPLSKVGSEKHQATFNKLVKLDLTTFGNSVLNWLLTVEDEEIYKIYLSEGGDSVVDRPDHNIVMVKLGLELMKTYFDMKGLTTSIIDEAKVKFQTTQEETIKKGVGSMSVVDQMLIGMFVMADKKLLKEGSIVPIEEVGQVAIWVSGVYPDFREWSKKSERDLDYDIIPEREFTDQLQKMDYFEDHARNKRLSANGAQHSYWVVDSQKLIDRDILPENVAFPERVDARATTEKYSGKPAEDQQGEFSYD